MDAFQSGRGGRRRERAGESQMKLYPRAPATAGIDEADRRGAFRAREIYITAPYNDSSLRRRDCATCAAARLLDGPGKYGDRTRENAPRRREPPARSQRIQNYRLRRRAFRTGRGIPLSARPINVPSASPPRPSLVLAPSRSFSRFVMPGSEKEHSRRLTEKKNHHHPRNDRVALDNQRLVRPLSDRAAPPRA